MGEDKALIAWQGIPILQRVCQVAASCCPHVYILTPWPKRYQEILGDRYSFLTESQPGRGPLVAFAEGLSQLTEVDWILLLACDLPQLDAEELQRWSAQLNRLPLTTLALVPQRNEFWEPLCGFYRVAARSSLNLFIQEGGRSFQAWLSRLPVEALPLGETQGEMLFNCNIPEDL
jgi:molybdenum cofactor guanylyltransferase